MNTKHAKSPCCQGKIIKFGNRRRRCLICGKTWRVRKKKRGRKKKRISSEFVVKYLERKTLPQLFFAPNKNNYSKDQINRRMRRSLLTFHKQTPWTEIKNTRKYIAIADAMMIQVNGQMYTFYFILLRPVQTNKAIIMPPFVKEGIESWIGWHEAFECVPSHIFRLIKALVSDGHVGLVSIAKRNRLISQRCNFHAIARLQGRRSMWKRSMHQALGKMLYESANDILTNPDENEIQTSLDKIKNIIQQINSPKAKTIIKGFVKNYQDYRSYLKYPKLNLPRTSNSAEALVKSVRQMCRNAHGFRTINSLKLWVDALLKHKRTITCNGSLPTKLSR